MAFYSQCTRWINHGNECRVRKECKTEPQDTVTLRGQGVEDKPEIDTTPGEDGIQESIQALLSQRWK